MYRDARVHSVFVPHVILSELLEMSQECPGVATYITYENPCYRQERNREERYCVCNLISLFTTPGIHAYIYTLSILMLTPIIMLHCSATKQIFHITNKANDYGCYITLAIYNMIKSHIIVTCEDREYVAVDLTRSCFVDVSKHLVHNIWDKGTSVIINGLLLTVPG